MNIYSGIIHNIQKMENTQMSINEQISKQNMVYSNNGIWVGHKIEMKSWYTLQYWMNLDSIMLSEFEARHKGLSSASLYLHEMSRTGKSVATGSRLVLTRNWVKKRIGSDFWRVWHFFQGNENILELDRDDCCTTLWK